MIHPDGEKLWTAYQINNLHQPIYYFQFKDSTRKHLEFDNCLNEHPSTCNYILTSLFHNLQKCLWAGGAPAVSFPACP